MKLDEQLRTAYKEESREWMVSGKTKHNVMNAIRKESFHRGHRKKWLITVLLAAILIIPTGAYAGYTYLADRMYGSQENITAMGGTAEDYMRLEAKLQAAKGSLSEDEFVQYMDLLKEMGQMALKHADSQGNLHPDQWSVTDQKQYNLLVSELEPFFEKLEAVSVESESPRKFMNEQQFWKEQLVQAEKTFTIEQYREFKSVYEQMKKYEIIMVDKDGSIHEERLSDEQKEDLRQIQKRLIPYLERLGLDIR
ncbi:DUF3600 domain-containing protein [Halomonas sp. ISL-60]|nr:DUF3600 domain-containing protein [Halomonas sp. ISL-60]